MTDTAPRPSAPRGVELVLLDVNETLTDTTPLADVLTRAGAPAALAPTWFAGVLRDGFALTAVGAAAPFADVGRSVARTVLHGQLPPERVEDVAQALVGAVGELPLHPDVAPGLAALAASGVRVAVLTNGSAATAEQLLVAGGVRDRVERVLSVADGPGGAWKPAASAYRWALGELGVDLRRAALAAVHPWDVDGAARAGTTSAWIDRSGAPWPAHLPAPGLVVASLTDLARALDGR